MSEGTTRVATTKDKPIVFTKISSCELSMKASNNYIRHKLSRWVRHSFGERVEPMPGTVGIRRSWYTFKLSIRSYQPTSVTDVGSCHR